MHGDGDDDHLDDLELADEFGVEAVLHLARFRRVSNAFPRRVAEAYGGDLAAALADPDEQVLATVSAYERAHGLPVRDWVATGRAERDDDDGEAASRST